MSQRVPQTNEMLQNHFNEQVSFLCRSTSSFDSGYEDEAKRLAHILRLLLHNTKQSRSLLDQLCYQDRIMFWDTAIPGFEPNHYGPVDGLTRHVYNSNGMKSIAPLDNLSSAFGNRLIKFNDWWDQPVIRDNNDTIFTRKDIVLNVADTDGGSHVDPGLTTEYTELTVNNSMGWWAIENNNKTGIAAPHLPSIRQICHEVLCSLAYSHPEAFVNSKCLSCHSKIDFMTIPIETCTTGRNDLCPCGSGRKYKKCHLMIQTELRSNVSQVKDAVRHCTPASITVVRKPNSKAFD